MPYNKNPLTFLLLLLFSLGFVIWTPSVIADIANNPVDTGALSPINIELIANQYAAENSEENVSSGWDLLIPIMVLAVCASVVYLCYQAIRVWNGYWRSMALAPLVILGLWLAVIVLAKFVDPKTHELWPFEVFAWSMGTTIYLVVLMTAKRTFDKAAAPKI